VKLLLAPLIRALWSYDPRVTPVFTDKPAKYIGCNTKVSLILADFTVLRFLGIIGFKYIAYSEII